MKKSRLFLTLPEDYVCTPDSMAIDHNGDLILSCPNFAQDEMSGNVLKITKNKEVSKWFDVPVHEETGIARNMGIDIDEDGYIYLCDNQGWSGREDLVFKGRLLKLKVDPDGTIKEFKVIAKDMEHPNGVKVKDGYAYVTQSYMHPVKDPSGKLTSGVYKFCVNDENVSVKNDLSDKNVLATFITENPQVQYGADGIAFDKEGNLYVSNFGDATVIKITFNSDGTVNTQEIFADAKEYARSIDGMDFDDKGNLYLADFSGNGIAVVKPDGEVLRIAESPDSDGLNGEINQPGEPRVWQDKLLVTCFDLVTGPDKVNTGHSLPATMAELDLI